MNTFKLPIHYLNNKTKIEKHIISDLDLTSIAESQDQDDIKNKNNTNNKNLDSDSSDDETSHVDDKITSETEISSGVYEHVFSPNTAYSKKLIKQWCEYYTSDRTYIKDTQNLLAEQLPDDCKQLDKFENIYNNTERETSFHSKYSYINNTWPLADRLNNSALFLLFLGMYNILSPVMTLATPIFFILLPFFIIKLQGYPITIQKYKQVLYNLAKKHQIGKIFVISSASWDQRIYILISLAFYIFQIYQNYMSCVTFCKNSATIYSELDCTKTFIEETIYTMDKLENICREKTSYGDFINMNTSHKKTLEQYHTLLCKIKPAKCGKFTIRNCGDMGKSLMCFNKLYNDATLKESLVYSLYLHGYLDNLKSLQHNLRKNILNPCKLSNKSTKFKNAFYPPLKEDTVKNSYNLKKQHLITGPNASGKTTILKATLFNIIISQQVGCGFYDKATINPYDKIHSYINIPDTSGRDSLFQAEARRCKNIIDNITIENNPNIRHFCVFDELYSGTNPYEAIGSAVGFLNYINKHKNINFMITTHFLDICKKLDKNKSFENYSMNVKELDNNFTYTYKIKKGISTIKGGVKVLRDLDYPQQIIEETTCIMKTLNI